MPTMAVKCRAMWLWSANPASIAAAAAEAPLAQAVLNEADLQADVIGVRRQSGPALEEVDRLPAAKSRERRENVEADVLFDVGMEIVDELAGAGVGQGALGAIPEHLAGQDGNDVREGVPRRVARQRQPRCMHHVMDPLEARREHGVVAVAALEVGKRGAGRVPAIGQDLRHRGLVDVEHALHPAGLDGCVAVMDVAGPHRHEGSGRNDVPLAAAPDRMHAAGDDADQVFGMGMRLERLAHVVGGQRLEATMPEGAPERNPLRSVDRARHVTHGFCLTVHATVTRPLLLSRTAVFRTRCLDSGRAGSHPFSRFARLFDACKRARTGCLNTNPWSGSNDFAC